MQTYIELIHN